MTFLDDGKKRESQISPQEFALIANNDHRCWMVLVGREVDHRTYGRGRVHNVRNTVHGIRLDISFSADPGELRCFEPASFIGDYFVGVSLSMDHAVSLLSEALAGQPEEPSLYNPESDRQDTIPSSRENIAHDITERIIMFRRMEQEKIAREAAAQREEERKRAEDAAEKNLILRLIEFCQKIQPTDPSASYLAYSLAELLARRPVGELQEYLTRMPPWTLAYSAVYSIFSSLRLEEQLRIIWLTLGTNDCTFWRRLPVRLQLFCIFGAAYKRRMPLLLRSLAAAPTAEHPLVQFGLGLLVRQNSHLGPHRPFSELNDLLIDWVLDQAWESTEPIELDPFLPRCPMGLVSYCEGKPWPTDEDKTRERDASRVWCYRGRAPCAHFDSDPSLSSPYPLTGARVRPVQGLRPLNWSILELLEATNVVPEALGIKKPDDYVPKLAGWINRLNEIRERMRCSVCNEVMVPNGRYAKNLAVYNATVMSCRGGVGHDTGIYLSHCWACRELIDSRESRIREDGYYLCIHCGSGRRGSRTFTQGDRCPRCGFKGMKGEVLGGNSLRCRNPECRHTILLPQDYKLTGRLIDKACFPDETAPFEPFDPFDNDASYELYIPDDENYPF